MALPTPNTLPTLSDSGISQVLAVTSRLTKILEQEIEMLEAGRPREIAQFQSEKIKLMGHYQREMKTFKIAARSPEKLNQNNLAAVKAATNQFVRALGAHSRILTAKRTATEGILQAIGKEVALRNKPVQSYQKNGTLGPAMPNYAAARPTTLSLDQRV